MNSRDSGCGELILNGYSEFSKFKDDFPFISTKIFFWTASNNSKTLWKDVHKAQTCTTGTSCVRPVQAGCLPL